MRWAFLLCSLLAFAGCRPAARTPREIGLMFTCDVRGRLVPCGCFTGQMGGLTRVATFLDDAPRGTIKMDVGDAIEGPEDFHRLEYRHILAAFGEMGYDAINLGHREAQHGAAHL